MECKEITPSTGVQPLQGRREVLGLFGGGAMAAAGLGFAGHAKAQAEASGRLGPGAVAGHMSADQTAFFSAEAPVFRAFAQQFSLDPKVVYLMAGQKGSQPISVRKRSMRCAPMPVCGTRLRNWSSSCGQPRTSCAR